MKKFIRQQKKSPGWGTVPVSGCGLPPVTSLCGEADGRQCHAAGGEEDPGKDGAVPSAVFGDHGEYIGGEGAAHIGGGIEHACQE